MPYIQINEIDETGFGLSSETTDIVYIPGLVDTVNNATLYDDSSEYIGLEPFKPHLFTSVDEFETLCGTLGYVFQTPQSYNDLTDSVGGYAFNVNAIPSDGILIQAGTIDPAYVMAKELLASGLQVMYERINADEQNVYEAVTQVPTDSIPYYHVEDNYTSLRTSGKAPDIYTPITPYMVQSVDGTTFVNSSYTGNETVVQASVDADGKIEYYEDTNNTLSYYMNYTSSQLQNLYIFTNVYKPTSVDVLATAGEFVQSTTYAAVFIEGLYFDENDFPLVNLNNASFTKRLVSSTGFVTGQTFMHSPDGWESIIETTSGDNGKTRYALVPNDYLKEYKTYYLHTGEAYLPLDYSDDNNVVVNLSESAITFTVPGAEMLATTTLNSPMYIDNRDVTLEEIYSAFAEVFDSSRFNGLGDKGLYSIKYLTSGGYPVYEYNNGSIVSMMLNLCEFRGDCVALIDHTDNVDRAENINNPNSLYASVENSALFDANGSYGAMFTPWVYYNRITRDGISVGSNKLTYATSPLNESQIRMPASYAYLTSLADSIKTNANWLAIAGSARGSVLNIADGGMTTEIANSTADAMQPKIDHSGIAVNAITNIRPYGYTIWGNRTLERVEDTTKALAFLNIRNAVSDIKKTVYQAARKLTFEPNTDRLWLSFRALITPLLDRMVTGYGLSGYDIKRNTTREEATNPATVCADIIIYPVYAVEEFYVNITLRDGEVTIE